VFLRLVRNEVESGINGFVTVDRRWNGPGQQRLYRGDRLHGSGGPDHVTRHGFDGTHRHPPRTISEKTVNQRHLCHVVQLCSCSMRIHTVDLLRAEPRVVQGLEHGSKRTRTFRMWSRQMVSVGGAAVTDDLSKNLRPSDRKSTRLNSSHVSISYAVFCL